MADQTHGAVASLLGILSSAIKDEARLVGGVHGDVQFIKDEMDSMNGFLLHLIKTEGDHDDQQRAWMKQVREIAYIAEDYIELYRRDLDPPDGGGGRCALLRHLPFYICTWRKRRSLATKIRELKVRVHDVGERRQRYGVTVPSSQGLKKVSKTPGPDRDVFRRALEEDVAKAIALLPSAIQDQAGLKKKKKKKDQAAKICAILDAKCSPPKGYEKFSCTAMFLCALCINPSLDHKELDKLKSKLEDEADGPSKFELLLIFCYSRLSTQQKMCLQYLSAFVEETSISRTSLVRRWMAEGFVREELGKTAEEVGECCFNDLIFLCFIRPDVIGDNGKVKSCRRMDEDDPIGKFIVEISKSENFVATQLPPHLNRQLEIRKAVRRAQPQKQAQEDHRRSIWRDRLCCGGDTSRAGGSAEASDFKAPMDELVEILKSLPETYRLNVLDLGGCTGLKKRHLKSICKVSSLKYLSLRKTDVSGLPARRMQALRFLETLDIRQTSVPPNDLKHIYLPNLKHLLASRGTASGGSDNTVAMASSTVQVPHRVGKMRKIEILSHVQVSDSGAELDGVAKLPRPRLRKLGVVVHGNEQTAKLLNQVIINLRECLRSLSIWVTGDGTLDISLPASDFKLESLDIRGTNSLPSWINQLHNLVNVTLRDTRMREGHLQNIGSFRGLRCLRLRGNSYGEQVLAFRHGKFVALRFLVVEVDATITSIVFEDGAAPCLEKIVLIFQGTNKEKEVTISGIEDLSRPITMIELRGDNADNPKLLKLEQVIAAHSKRPLTFRYGVSFEHGRDIIVTAE